MSIQIINDGELGSSVRTKLNDSIQRGNRDVGYATFVDTQYTLGSPLVVNQGATVDLPNNSTGDLITYLPENSSGLYNGTRLVADNVGDEYTLRISIGAFTTSNSGGFDLSIDISALGDGSITIVRYPVRMFRGTGSANAQVYTINVPYFTLGTFIANGGLIRLESITGNTSVYGIQYYIRKIAAGEYF